MARPRLFGAKKQSVMTSPGVPPGTQKVKNWLVETPDILLGMSSIACRRRAARRRARPVDDLRLLDAADGATGAARVVLVAHLCASPAPPR